MPHVDQTTDDGVQADTRAAVEQLRGLGCSSVFTRRLLLRRPCVVGRGRVRVTASPGAIGFYGSPTRQRGGAERRSSASTQIECPILALQAGDDPGITAEDNAAFEQALTGAGVEHEIVVYDGAPHSFFDRKQEEFADASDDAWRRTLAFIDSHA